MHAKSSKTAVTKTQAGEARPDYPLRVSSFFASLGVHAVGITTLLLVGFPGGPPLQRTARPIYEELIKPYEHEVLYYDFRKAVPDVDPVEKVGRGPIPRGTELSDQAIIASSKKPKSKQVFISVQAPKIEIHQDPPAALLIAKAKFTLPPPPPAPPKPKKFVPPSPSKREPNLPIQTPVVDAQAPALASPVASAPLANPSLNLSLVAPPLRDALEAPTARSGNAKADVVVASLHPSPDVDNRVPNGERPARFSKAPTQGEAASGDTSAAASLTVPDLTVRQPKLTTPPATPSREILYAERVRGIPISSLSIPLRPSSRMIPPAVEGRLQGRNVYTIVIPMEHMPTYTGDWIIWFADRERTPGTTPLVRAPVPFRKLEPIVFDQPTQIDRNGERIQFAATLGKNGKLDGISLLTKATPSVQRAVLQDLSSWEFQPATRDGVQMDVDLVLEIPFNVPTALARVTQP